MIPATAQAYQSLMEAIQLIRAPTQETDPAVSAAQALLNAYEADLASTRAQLTASEANNAALREALQAAREKLHCAPANNKELHEMQSGEWATGHWCSACDEYVDRNGPLRARIGDALSSPNPGARWLEALLGAREALEEFKVKGTCDFVRFRETMANIREVLGE